MDFADARKKIRGLILGITGLIIALLFIRVVIDFLDSNSRSGIANTIREITNFLISPVQGIIEISTATEIDAINVTALLAIFVYFIIGLVIAEVITAFLYDRIEDIILNVVDAVFKLIEFVLFLRILFDLLQVSKVSPLSEGIYSITDWADGAIVNIKLLGDRLDISIVLILIFVVIIDIVSESLLRGVISKPKRSDTGSQQAPGKQVTTINNYGPPVIGQRQVPSNLVQKQIRRPAPPTQNITVNIPVPQQPIQPYFIQQPRQVVQAGPVPATINTSVITPPPMIGTPKNPVAKANISQYEVPHIPKVNPPSSIVKKTHVLKPLPQQGTTFGQSYTFKSLPSRFNKTTIYGEGQNVNSKKSGLKKFFGSN